MPPCILDSWLSAKLAHIPSSEQDLAQSIKNTQWQLLRKTLFHAAKHSTFYAKAFSHIDLERVTAQNFSTLPFTTAEDLQQPEKLLCVSQAAVARMVTLQSSGTTAPPKRMAFNHEDLEATKDFFSAGMAQLIRPGQRLLVLWPGAMRPHGVSALLRDALASQNIVVVAGEAQTTAQSLSKELQEHAPHVLVAAPRQLRILIQILLKNPALKQNLQAVLASAEYLPADVEQSLENLGLLVLDHYGITEAGYGGGVECLHKQGYHMRELDIFTEVIHPKTLQILPFGEVGEIILTTLQRKAMPLIRYRTGDVAALLQGPCPCGSPLSRLSRVQGRLVYTHCAKGYTVEHHAKGAFYERSVGLSL